MNKRFITLIALVALLGVATQAFGQAAPVASKASFSRAEAVALLVEANPVLKSRLDHFVNHMPPMPLFSDVDQRGWEAVYIEVAFEAGLITGNSERMFRPQDIMTEQEAIVIAARMHAMDHQEMLVEMAVHDENWFNGAVMASIHNGLELPFPIRLNQPVKGSDFYALLQSMGVQNPQQLVITHTTVAPPRVVATVTQPVIRPITASTTAVIPTTPTPAPQPTTPAPTVAQPSQKNFAISLPSLGVKDLTITHPSDPFTKDGLLAPLKNGVGHLFSYPGKGGTILVYGHSSSVPWDISDYTKIFRQINKLNVGDRIEITYAGTLYTYEVTMKQTVPADDMTAYAGGNGEELILYTCWPPDSIKERYLVHAKPVKVAVK